MLLPNDHKLRWKVIGVVFVCSALVSTLVIFFLIRMDSTDEALQGGVAPPALVPVAASSSSKIVSSAREQHVVAFGDSVTAGHGIPLPDAYPAQLERALRDRGYPTVVVNSGVTGETTAGGLRRASFVAERQSDIVLIALGGNDVLRGIDPDSTKKNLAGIIKIFQQAGAKVILVGMYAPANLGEVYVAKFNAIYPALAAEFNVPLVPFLLEGVVFESTLNQNDGIHPNKEGARIIAEQNILPHLLPLLTEAYGDK